MNSSGKRMRSLAGCLVIASTLSTGCLSFCHPLGLPPHDQIETCRTFPPCCRNHVYVFFVNGLDPLGYANFAGLRDYVQSLGFIKTYYGQFYHEATFAREIRRLHGEDPLAHFVVVGLNLGVNAARDLVDAVRSDGVVVDLLVNVGADLPGAKSENAGRVVNLRSTDEKGNGLFPDYSGSAIPSDHDLPAERFTLAALAHELATVAAAVPVVALGKLAESGAPSRTMPQADAPMGDWDFLRPRPPAGESPAPASPHKSPNAPKEPAPLPPSIGRI